MSFSILILTFNEEANLKRHLPKYSRISDDIVILDSFSTDNTVKVAQQYGCSVFSRKWDSEDLQRAYSLKLPFKNSWVYNPDADEFPDEQLLSEMTQSSKSDSNNVAYEVRFKNIYNDRWIRYSTDYPVWVVRFFQPEKVSFGRIINLEYKINGNLGRFKGHFLHYPFSKGLDWWIAKHNTYSSKEAIEMIKIKSNSNFFASAVSVLVARNSKTRRVKLKELSFYLPLRGIARFTYSYFMRGGFLDGRNGLYYCILISYYEFLISIKARMNDLNGE